MVWTAGAEAINGTIYDSEKCFVCCILATTPEDNSARGQVATPYTLHPTPYTYTPLPTPLTLHPTPCTLHP